MSKPEEALKELEEKHRALRVALMALMEKSARPNWDKERIRQDMFKIYMEYK